MKPNQLVSREEWLDARRALLAREKELTHRREALAAERRKLPWVRIEKDYVFEGPDGRVTLADLFDGRSQLLVYHFMFGPDWNEGCPSCSFWTDNYHGAVVHLAARDVTLAVVSRAPIDKIEAFRARMGWTAFRWVSSHRSDFNYDFEVSFTPEQLECDAPNYNFGTVHFGVDEGPGVSVFARCEDGTLYHTYSTFSRGLDWINGTYQMLDLVPKGRDEEDLSYNQAWVKHRDRY